MFYDNKIDLLSAADWTVIKSIEADVQPCSKTYPFEDSYVLDVTHRAFCDSDTVSELGMGSYVRFEHDIYMIVDLKIWSDYMELYLYRCKSDFV